MKIELVQLISMIFVPLGTLIIGIIAFFLKQTFMKLDDINKSTITISSKVDKIETTIRHMERTLNKTEVKVTEHDKLLTTHHAALASLNEFKKRVEIFIDKNN